MNFKGLGTFGAIVLVVLGILMAIPAIISSVFANTPWLAVTVSALCGALGGLKLSRVKGPVCFGSGAAVASLTLSCLVVTFGGGITGWSVGVPCAIAAAITTMFVLMLLLPDAKRTPPEL